MQENFVHQSTIVLIDEVDVPGISTAKGLLKVIVFGEIFAVTQLQRQVIYLVLTVCDSKIRVDMGGPDEFEIQSLHYERTRKHLKILGLKYMQDLALNSLGINFGVERLNLIWEPIYQLLQVNQ